MHSQRKFLINNEAGVRVYKSYCSIVCDIGGYKSLTFVERDVRNFVDKERRHLEKEKDGETFKLIF